MGAVARKNETADVAFASTSGREDLLARYCHLRKISMCHHSEVMSYLSADAILHHARRLGFTVRKTLVLQGEEELTLVFDLAIYTARLGRSRAIDRYAGLASFAQGSDEAIVVDAMRRARFSVLEVVRRHEAAGLVVNDLFRGEELWLVDEGMESSVPDGSLIATRIFSPDVFFMTTGTGVPFDCALLEDVLDDVPLLRRKRPPEVLEDWRFAEAVYRLSAQDADA